MTLKNASLTLVGCGNMGSAMLKSWLKTEQLSGGITIISPHKPSAEPYLQDPRCRWTPSPEKVVKAPDFLIFAVKPQVLPEILPLYKNIAGPDTLILSVAAGKPLAFYKTYFGALPFIRLMPNTPAAVGKGIILAVPNETVSPFHEKAADLLLSPLGALHWLRDEALFDAYSALTGSGPAFVFAFAEALGEAARETGLDPALSVQLAEELLIGSAAYLESSSKSAAELRQEVTSPKGMTEAGLVRLISEGRLKDLLKETLKAAAERARELGRSET